MELKTLALTVLMCPAAAAAAETWFVTDLEYFMKSAARVEVPAPSRSHNGNKYFSRDCASLELGAGEGDVESEKAELYSQEFIEECKPLPPKSSTATAGRSGNGAGERNFLRSPARSPREKRRFLRSAWRGRTWNLNRFQFFIFTRR